MNDHTGGVSKHRSWEVHVNPGDQLALLICMQCTVTVLLILKINIGSIIPFSPSTENSYHKVTDFIKIYGLPSLLKGTLTPLSHNLRLDNGLNSRTFTFSVCVLGWLQLVIHASGSSLYWNILTIHTTIIPIVKAQSGMWDEIVYFFLASTFSISPMHTLNANIIYILEILQNSTKLDVLAEMFTSKACSCISIILHSVI